MSSGRSGFVFEQDRCMGCHTCEVACSETHDLGAGQHWRRVIEFAEGEWSRQQETVHACAHAWYLSISCNHCALPTCVDNCPTGAMRREPDGFVLIEPSSCIGCAYCVWSCPYGAPQLDASQGRVRKCDGCADRVRRGEQPACVDACPVRALSYGPLDASWSASRGARGLPGNELTRPSLAVRPHRDAIVREKS